MNIKPLIAAASLSCLFVASPVFAQDSTAKTQDLVKDKVVEEVKNTATDMVTEDMAAPEDAVIIKGDKIVNKPDGEVIIKGAPAMIKTPDQMIEVQDGTIAIREDTVTIEGSEIQTSPDPQPAPEPILAPVAAPAVTQIDIACPYGTTAQADGTCMITGDYKG